MDVAPIDSQTTKQRKPRGTGRAKVCVYVICVRVRVFEVEKENNEALVATSVSLFQNSSGRITRTCLHGSASPRRLDCLRHVSR